MNFKSSLQNALISKIIDKHGDKEGFISSLERCRAKVTFEDRVYFDNTILYFNRLFVQDVTVEQDALDFKQAALDTIDCFQRNVKHLGCDDLLFAIDLIQFKLRSVGITVMRNIG